MVRLEFMLRVGRGIDVGGIDHVPTLNVNKPRTSRVGGGPPTVLSNL
jgi:hypothetical protein